MYALHARTKIGVFLLPACRRWPSKRSLNSLKTINIHILDNATGVPIRFFVLTQTLICTKLETIAMNTYIYMYN